MGHNEAESLQQTMDQARELLSELRGVQKDLKREVTAAKKVIDVPLEKQIEKLVNAAIADMTEELNRVLAEATQRLHDYFREMRDHLVGKPGVKMSIGELAVAWGSFRERVQRDPGFMEWFNAQDKNLMTAVLIVELEKLSGKKVEVGESDN